MPSVPLVNVSTICLPKGAAILPSSRRTPATEPISFSHEDSCETRPPITPRSAPMSPVVSAKS